MSSKAARCITLSLLDGEKQFHPEFTHQIFGPSESIPGYRSYIDEDESKTDKVKDVDKEVVDGDEKPTKRVKFNVVEELPKKLELVIRLSPSCSSCEVRYKCEGSDKGSDSVEVKDDGNGHSTEVSNLASSKAATGRMPIMEVIKKLKDSLPPVIRVVNDTEPLHISTSISEEYLSKPFGDVLEEYVVEKAGNKETFVLSLAEGSDNAASDYHTKIQNLSLFFIETAEAVDISCCNDGSWKVLYLFLKHGNEKYSFVGYITLFCFNAPFKRPKSGIVLRVCQALVLPPYQRHGHGRKLIQAVYQYASKEGKQYFVIFCNEIFALHTNSISNGIIHFSEVVVEVNVEDPAPSFTSLRDKVDYENLMYSINNPTDEIGRIRLPQKYIDSCPDAKSFFLVLPDTEAVPVAVHAKILPRQVQIAHEIYKLNILSDWLVEKSDDEKAEKLKKFRLMVKQRLVKVYKEDLGAFDDKASKQAKLQEFYLQVQSHYCEILGQSWPALVP